MMDDYGWATITRGGRIFFPIGYSFHVRNISSCSDKEKYVFYNNRTYLAYTQRLGPTIFLQPITQGTTTVHETGHSLCNLQDEYLYDDCNKCGLDDCKAYGNLDAPNNNCATNPLFDFKYSFVTYGTSNLGCTYTADFQFAHATSYYRSTRDSIMRFSKLTPKFNVVSCGYCVAALNGVKAPKSQDAKPYWQECLNMDTINITTYTAC